MYQVIKVARSSCRQKTCSTAVVLCCAGDVSGSLVKFFFWLYLLVLVWGGATAANNYADPDLWHRLALGEALWKTGHFPPGDAFSYLSDYKDVIDHEWGSAVLFYAIYQCGGDSAIVIAKYVALGVTMALLVLAGLRTRSPGVFLAAFYAVVLLALLPSFASTIRCMIFTHIFFALWLYWFQCERHGRPIPIYFYIGTMIVWANLHGGFAIGLVWLAAVGIVELVFRGNWKKWAVRFGACSLATLVNPFGPQLWVSTGRALLTPRIGFHEWEPVSWWPDVISYPGYKLLLPGLIIALIIKGYRHGWTRIDWPIVILIGVFATVCIPARNTSLFALVAGALAPGLFSGEVSLLTIADPLTRLGHSAVRSSLILIPFFCVLIGLPGDGLQLRYGSSSCPVQAVDYLQIRKVRGNLLVPFNYGSYALWELRGQMRVSMDGRYDLVYLPKTYRRVDDFFSAHGDWPSLLTSPAPNAILVPIVDPVFPKLQAEPGWKEVYHDDTDAVFLPRG